MKIREHYITLSLTILLLGCHASNKSTNCLQIKSTQVGDTLVINNSMNGVNIEDFNFIIVTEKYLQGITEDEMDFKLRVELYTRIDSSKRKLEAFILKTNESKQNIIDYISCIHDENPINPNDKSKPYIIHPVTGDLNRIENGILIRKIINERHAGRLIENALAINEWNQFQWEENSTINFSIDLLNKENKSYYGNCKTNIPKSIIKTLNNFGIEN